MTAGCSNSLSVSYWLHHSGFSCTLGRRRIPATLHVVLARILQLGCVAHVSPQHHLKNTDILLSTQRCLVSTTTTLDFSGDFQCCRALVHACWKENGQVHIYHKCNPRYFLDLAFPIIHIPTLVMQFHYTSGCSTCCDLVDILQTSQQAMVWGSWRCYHLKHRLEGPPIQFFINLVSVEVYGHQTEDVNIHLL